MPKRLKSVDGKIGWNLFKLRKAAGVSQQKLGEACGVSYQQIAKYEAGVTRISMSTALMICDRLGIPVSYLLDGVSGQDTIPTERNCMMVKLESLTDEQFKIISGFIEEMT